MKIAGQRVDGALHLALGGGVSVVLRGQHMSRPLDESVAERMGPWHAVVSSFDSRRRVERMLETARVVPISQLAISLDMSFDERRERVCNALCEKLGMPKPGSNMPMSAAGPWIPTNGLGEEWVVYCMDGKHFVLGYDIDDMGVVTFTEGEAEEVVQAWQTLAERAAEEAREEVTRVEPASEGGGAENVDLSRSVWRFSNPDGINQYTGGGGAGKFAAKESTERATSGERREAAGHSSARDAHIAAAEAHRMAANKTGSSEAARAATAKAAALTAGFKSGAAAAKAAARAREEAANSTTDNAPGYAHGEAQKAHMDAARAHGA